IGPVESLSQKLRLAQEWVARELFLPAENQREALEWAQQHGRAPQLEPLMPVAADPQPRKLLEKYLARLGVPPGFEAPLRQRRRPYAAVDRRTADGYHWTHLLPDIIARCRGRFEQEHPACRPTHCVSVVSASPSAVALGPAVVGASRCLLLHEQAPEGPPAP